MTTVNERIARSAVWDGRAYDFLSTWNLTEEEVLSVIRNDHKPTLDPSSKEAGHPILRFRQGDVVAVVGLREIHRPVILSIFVVIPGMKEHRERTSRGGSGSSLPTTTRQLRSWIIGFGYGLRPGKTHDIVYDKETGAKICSISCTPSDGRTLGNTWKMFLREHAINSARKKALQNGTES